MHRALVPTLALLAAGLAPAAAAVDLTGTWSGKQTCRGLSTDGLNEAFQIRDSVVEISQVGSEVRLRVDGQDDYAGQTIDDARKPAEKGRLFLVRCTTDDVPGPSEGGWDETSDGVVSSKANGKGKLKALSTFLDAGGIGNCKWKYKRVDTADPAAPGCTPPP